MPSFTESTTCTSVAAPLPPRRVRRKIPAVWLRAGTSKGIYLHRRDLPPDVEQWQPIISRIMGSYDSDPKQLDGIGGATSTTSKCAIVSPSTRPDADVDYTFVQVSIGSPKLDTTGNCGNIASGVGPFAVDEGLIMVRPGQRHVQIRVFNTNTQMILTETVAVDENGHFLEDGDCSLPGLFSRGSRVRMAFASPGGAMTGKLLPTGRATETLLLPAHDSSLPPLAIQASLVDAANPFCLVDATTLPESFHSAGPRAASSLQLIESIRRVAAVMMGLAPTEAAAALTKGTPKIAVLFSPTFSLKTNDGARPDFECIAYSMGTVHGSLQLTGAVCLGSAACIRGTVPYELRERYKRHDSPLSTPELDAGGRKETVKLRHPGGDMDVEVRLGTGGVQDQDVVEEVTVFRTARRLFEGNVCFLA